MADSIPHRSAHACAAMWRPDMIIELKCAEPGHTDKKWLLELQGHSALLTTVAGDSVGSFSREEARSRFRLPSLAEQQSHFAIALEEQTVRFNVAGGQLNQIERFLDPPPPRNLSPATVTAKASSAAFSSAGSFGMMIDQPTGRKKKRKGGITVTRPVRLIFGIIFLPITLLYIIGLIVVIANVGIPHPAWLLGRMTAIIVCVMAIKWGFSGDDDELDD
jgi:hypothetical protein